MILNTGLDAACQNNSYHGGTSYPYFASFIQYAAYGTGSTAPAATDTALVSQSGARSANNGGFANNTAAGLDGTSHIMWYEGTFVRVFTIGGNVNATEWGLAVGSTGNLSVRELFRADPNDNGSSPITLTLESGDELQLVVTLRVEAAWEYESKSFVITGTTGNDANGTHTGNASLSSGASTAEADVTNTLRTAWPGGYYLSPSFLHVITSDQTSKTIATDLSNSSANGAMVNQAYTPGNYYRDASYTFGTGAANGDHYAWVSATDATSNLVNRGLRFILTDPVKLTKLSTHKLTLTVRKSIARL